MTKHIIFDFDGTITEDDTIGNIAQAALQWRKTPEGGSSSTDLATDWARILQSYAADLAAYDLTQLPATQRTTWQQERDYLHGRRVVDEASLARVRAARIFAAFPAHGRLVEAGRRDRQSGRTRIRRGFGELVAALRARDVAVHVVSVNWSASYIRGVLEPWGITSIIANELQLDGSVAASSPLDGKASSHDDSHHPKTLATSRDKLEATRTLLGKAGGQCLGYFGDSTTDMECLVLCGGYVLTPDGGGSLVSALRRLGHDVAHVSEARADDAEGRIFWARDFTEMPGWTSS